MNLRTRVSLKHLLQNLHGKLGCDRTAGDKLIEGVGEGHSDSKPPRHPLQLPHEEG